MLRERISEQLRGGKLGRKNSQVSIRPQRLRKKKLGRDERLAQRRDVSDRERLDGRADERGDLVEKFQRWCLKGDSELGGLELSKVLARGRIGAYIEWKTEREEIERLGADGDELEAEGKG